MYDYKECTLTQEEIVELVKEKLERAKGDYWNFQQKGKYGTEEEKILVESNLLTLELLAYQMGIIETCTL